MRRLSGSLRVLYIVGLLYCAIASPHTERCWVRPHLPPHRSASESCMRPCIRRTAGLNALLAPAPWPLLSLLLLLLLLLLLSFLATSCVEPTANAINTEFNQKTQAGQARAEKKNKAVPRRTACRLKPILWAPEKTETSFESGCTSLKNKQENECAYCLLLCCLAITKRRSAAYLHFGC